MPATTSDDPEPFMHARFTPGRPTVRPGEEVTHGLGEVTQRLLLHRLRPRRQPANSFLASVSWRDCSA